MDAQVAAPQPSVESGNSPWNTASPEYQEEVAHFQRVGQTFSEYHCYMGAEVDRRRRHFARLHPDFVARLPRQSGHAQLQALEAAVYVNQRFLKSVIDHQGDSQFGPCQLPKMVLPPPPGHAQTQGSTVQPWISSAANISKMKTTLRQCVRDWSEEGEQERRECFQPLLDELCRLLPVNDTNRNRQRVLVPGVGLGRLAVEICARGYACQGNEFSYFMLLTSNYLLNCLDQQSSVAIFPYIDSACNNKSASDMLRRVLLPDKTCHDLLADTTAKNGGEMADFSMAAGDFMDIYGNQVECWDCVVTCFFIDTAPVVLQYVETIHRILKPGGVWINLGPLLYHWAAADLKDLKNSPPIPAGARAGPGSGLDERYHSSVELSWEELRHVITTYGFQFNNEEWRECHYTSNIRSMMKTVYSCIFFSVQKLQTPLGYSVATGTR
uniref:carnosine N-methyltransferase n=1 Tax=Fibrocapsa japonica TaxID=94617 RepID=A0A7S2UVA9_9STRA|mmetsp:Transcript_1516/g.2096  ORF Transcript_1516/g.2096 Transcript_1516/m.2096 type:complete len:439 (+) Transcript_1516:122-1438(+)